MSEPIELMSVEDITDELMNRFDSFIICGIKSPKNGEEITYKASFGDPYRCIGLAELVKSVILEKEHKKIKEMDPKDER